MADERSESSELQLEKTIEEQGEKVWIEEGPEDVIREHGRKIVDQWDDRYHVHITPTEDSHRWRLRVKHK